LNKAVGWIFDAYVEDEKAVLWLRTDEDKVLRLTDPYSPSYYVLPRDEDDEPELVQLLQASSHITSITCEDKHTTLGEGEERRLLHVTVDRAFNFTKVVKRTELLPPAKALYNTDLLPVQQYLFTRLRIAPTSKIELDYDDSKRVSSVKLVDDSEAIRPPPFTSLLFDTHADDLRLCPHPRRGPLTCIDVSHGTKTWPLHGGEQAVLDQFASLVTRYDPDFLVCPESSKTAQYLFDRVKCLNLGFQLGREHGKYEKVTHPLSRWLRGRVLVDYRCFKDHGLAGLVERSRFSVLPPSIASRWTANRIIDSRNCYELLQRGYVIPKNEGDYEYLRSVEDVVDRDRGGLILAAKIGVVHENVAELDFESEYPNLIVHNGLSYETVTPNGLSMTADGLLPYVTQQILDRRLWFKRRRRKYDTKSQEWRWCEQRQLALKMILVCLYGTSGCCWNRFGNVLCFEEINRRSRAILVKTKNFVQQKGFAVVYADTDSLFVKKKGTTEKGYEALCEEIRQHVGLPIALDHHYKFFLLPLTKSTALGPMEAQKHYFGVLTSGEPLTRGIETRRHDCPRFVKAFQNKLIQTLFDAETAEAVYASGYKRAVDFVVEVVDRVMEKTIPLEELVVSKRLWKSLSEYTCLLPHVSAAVSLAQQGLAVKKGDTIDFLYVNARHRNPLRRVAPRETYASGYYDREKYRDLILDAAETVLSTFGFSKREFGLRPRSRSVQERLLLDLGGDEA
jgi:DNA polymerase I